TILRIYENANIKMSTEPSKLALSDKQILGPPNVILQVLTMPVPLAGVSRLLRPVLLELGRSLPQP
ncbi:MAG: hypothetical protein OXI30_13560, partial [Chloroflexota bacterium]|nr:hypothetical protein [Chloroflexota bacterium]